MRPSPNSKFYYEARPRQFFYLEEFIQPTHLEIQNLVENISGSTLDQVGKALFDINKKIEYKSDTDTYNATDYFCFPWETLLTKTGDCEDKSYLLASLLQACDVQNVSVVFGKVNLESRSYGHCWVKAEGKTIETTVDKYTPLPSTPEFYAPEVEIGWAWATQIAYPIEGWDIATTGIESFGASLKKVGKEEIEKLKEELEKYKPEEEKHIGGITLW